MHEKRNPDVVYKGLELGHHYARRSPGALCNIGFRPETHLQHKSRKISFVHNINFKCSVSLPCSVQNIKTIGQLINKLRVNKASVDLSLTQWGRVTHICVSEPISIGSDNGLSPTRRQATIWINAGILLIGPLGTNFSEIVLEIQTFSLRKMRLKMSSAKRQPLRCVSDGYPTLHKTPGT